MIVTATSAPHHRHIGCFPSSLVPHASCMLLWWSWNGYWVQYGRNTCVWNYVFRTFVSDNPLVQMSILTLLSMYLLILRWISCLLVAASVACWWHCGRLLRQEMLWCLISRCIVYWSLLCGRPWHDILSMLLHSYMSERCLWGSIHISSIVSHSLPLCDDGLKSSKMRTADHDGSPCSVYSEINAMMYLMYVGYVHS